MRKPKRSIHDSVWLKTENKKFSTGIQNITCGAFAHER